jgi:hypothetical protein
MKEERKEFVDVDEVPQDKLEENNGNGGGGGNSNASAADRDGKNLWWLAAIFIGVAVAIAFLTVLI